MDNRAQGAEPDIIGIDKPNTSSAPAAILWITFVLALGLTVFFYMASRSAINLVDAKESAKNDIITELNSPAYQSVEEKANSFKEAFDILNNLVNSRAPKKEILDELTQKFTNDVIIKNFAIGADGSLTLDGATGSYRQVADFMVGLQQYKRVSAARLNTVSLDESDEADPKVKVLFSITAKIDLAKEKPVEAAPVAETPSEPSPDDSAVEDSSSLPADDASSADSSLGDSYDSYDSYENSLSPADAAYSTEGGI